MECMTVMAMMSKISEPKIWTDNLILDPEILDEHPCMLELEVHPSPVNFTGAFPCFFQFLCKFLI